jgi:hypothetical protein
VLSEIYNACETVIKVSEVKDRSELNEYKGKGEAKSIPPEFPILLIIKSFVDLSNDLTSPITPA